LGIYAAFSITQLRNASRQPRLYKYFLTDYYNNRCDSSCPGSAGFSNFTNTSVFGIATSTTIKKGYQEYPVDNIVEPKRGCKFVCYFLIYFTIAIKILRRRWEIKRMKVQNTNSSSALHAAYVLSAVLAVVLILQSVGGLFISGLYRDNAWVISVFYGTDWVTLVIVVPILIGSLIASKRSSMRARFILMGTIYYVFYNNMYYLFSAFNRFFLVYVALFVLSAGAFIAALLGTKAPRMIWPERRTPRKTICATMLVCAAILAVMWLGQALLYIANSKLPQLIIDSGGSTHLVAAFDLTLIVPPLLLGAIWLWKSRPWGYVIATTMLIQCTIITLNLIITPAFQAAAGIKDAWTMVPLWALMGTAFLASSAYLLKGTRVEH